MKTYLLPLTQKSGLLTELQSDTIYGHFCWRLKEHLGSDKLNEFISQYKSNKPVFSLSDGLLKDENEILFPRPLVFSKPELKETKSEKIIEFIQRKSDKEQKYLTLSEMNEFLKTGKVVLSKQNTDGKTDKLKRTRPIRIEDLRVSVQIDRNTLGSSEGKLFSYNPTYTDSSVSFILLIKVLDESLFEQFSCDKILKDVFNIGFGKKKSSGYGQFETGELVEFNDLEEPTDSDAFLSLGNYLPSFGDYATPIGYDINTKYGKLGEELSQSENPFKNPIVLLRAGSCFKTTRPNLYYGRITKEGEISSSCRFAVQFGIPFILNFRSSVR